MCGFGGILNSAEHVNREQLAGIAAKVGFRGPDSCGVKVFSDDLAYAAEGPHGLFFNRLAIVDLDARSDQPFENDRYALTFNGEIYNYSELREELVQRGIRFATTSDTEVLFYMLIEFGAGALTRLNGMFALFWLDKKERKFLIARDRLGIKPLYYSHFNKSFIFSSEIDSIRRLTNDAQPISYQASSMYLWMQFVPSPHSIIEGIYKLPPGHFLEQSLNGSTTGRPVSYWDAYTYHTQKREAGNKSELEEILKDTLDRQLHADVPLGLFLSSGVDSSLLAAMMNKYYSKESPVNFFTVKFAQDTASDESDDAAEFIRRFDNPNLRCNTIEINPAFIQSHITDLYSFYDEPFGDMAAILNWAISKKARDYVTVAISGDGADELFWGYPRYSRWQKFARLNGLPGVGILRSALFALPHSKFTDDVRFALEKDKIKRHYNFFLTSGMRFKIRDHIAQKPMWALQNAQHILDRPDLTALIDIKTYLADAMLYKVDRSSMANSLEVRVPYLDNEVLDFALRMPLGDKSGAHFQHKKPLKELLTRLAPHYDLTRSKKGFSFPLEHWLRHHWKNLVNDTIDKSSLEKAGLDAAPYLKLVNDFYASKNNYFTDVWYLFNLSLWMKKSL